MTAYLVGALSVVCFAAAFWLILMPEEMSPYLRAVATVFCLIAGTALSWMAEEMATCT